MPNISITLPSDGSTADVADYNTPITTIKNAINGNLDSDNISSLNGSKIVAGTLPGSALDTSLAGGWLTGLAAPNTVTYNGNRNYTLTFNSVDYNSTLSAGMRLRTTRTVAAPTQCTSLNGTTQYYSKSSPAGMTFTDDYAGGAWIKLSSYPTASFGTIMSRFNGTSGWVFRVLNTGQIQAAGFNAGIANYRGFTSYQSVPLNKWVHVAFQNDMSTFTATPTTTYCMIDGVDVPVLVIQGGTNPTSLINNVGSLEIGTENAGSFFPGKIAQAFVTSAKVTQANVRTLISQGLTASLISSNNIISAYSFNGVTTDLNTTNANNLTANGSAVATNADSPFGTQASGLISSTLDYGIIQSVTFSTNTTVVVQVPEGCTISTSGGISAVVYSSSKAPYGMTIDKNKYRLTTIQRTDVATTSNATYGAYNSGGLALTLPIGSYAALGFGGGSVYSLSTTGDVTFSLAPSSIVGLSRTAGAALTRRNFRVLSSAASAIVTSVHIAQPEVVTSQTVYSIYSVGATTAAGIDGSNAYAEIFADMDYL